MGEQSPRTRQEELSFQSVRRQYRRPGVEEQNFLLLRLRRSAQYLAQHSIPAGGASFRCAVTAGFSGVAKISGVVRAIPEQRRVPRKGGFRSDQQPAAERALQRQP